MKITSRTALLLYLHSALHFKSASTVSEVRIGGSFPLLLSDGSVDPYGPQYLAAFLMAIEDVENKTDGLWDNLLPNVSIKYAIRGSPGPFIDDCSAGVDFARRVFNKQGVHGVIGGANDVASRALGQVFKYPKMVQVAYGSQGFDLSYSFPYPYYFRTTVDDLFYGTAMADIIVNHFGWKKISIFAITDFYSGSATAQLENIVTSKGIEVISTHEFGSGTEDLSKPIQEAKSYGSRIFMFYGLKPTDVRRLLRQGYEKGLFYEGTQIVGDANTVSADIWTNESQPSSSNLSRDPEIMRIMSGVIGIKLLSSFNGDLGERFISKWKKQRNTFSYADDGVTQECKIAMDSDGGTELYRANNTDSDGKVTTVCTGVTFTQFLKDDGSDIAPLASITYDATIALLKGLHTVIYDYGVTDDSKVGDGDVLGAAVQNVSFSGVSGDVKFRLGDPQTGFGFGDREVGQTFQVLNFHPVLYSLTRGQIAFQQIGTWTLEAGFTVGEWDLPPLFNTKNNALPLDSPQPVPVRMSVSLRGLLIAFAVLGILTTVFFAGVVVWKRHSRMIRASQPLMLAALLAGALVSCARVIAGSYDLTDEVCVAQTWTGHLAFGLICGALITKTWRVHMIINTTMKRVKITTNHVLIMIAAITALLAIYLTIFTVVGEPHVVLTVRDDGQLATSHLFSCQDSNGTFAIVLYVLEAVSLAYGVRLCMATKNAPGAVNESGAFGLALYVISFISVIVFPLALFLQLDAVTVQLLIAVGFAISTISSLVVLLGQKTMLLLEGADINARYEIVKKNDKKAVKSKEDRAATAATLAGATSSAANGASGAVLADERAINKMETQQKINFCKDQIERWQGLLVYAQTSELNSGLTGSSAARQKDLSGASASAASNIIQQNAVNRSTAPSQLMMKGGCPSQHSEHESTHQVSTIVRVQPSRQTVASSNAVIDNSCRNTVIADL